MRALRVARVANAMKLYRWFLFSCALLMLGTAFAARAQTGTLTFANTPRHRVIDGRDGLPVQPGVAVAGLYVTTDLSAVPQPGVALDEFQLVATVPVSTASNPELWGVFHGGNVGLPGTVPGQQVRVQIRIWLTGMASYAETFVTGTDLVAVSAVMGPVTLGGGIVPTPSLTTLDPGDLTLRYRPGNHNNLPVAHSAIFSTTENAPFNGTLTGSDYDGDSIVFSLASNGTFGSAVLGPGGAFAYTPLPDAFGTDTLRFRVNDGMADSPPASVVIHIQPLSHIARVRFNNSPTNLVRDGESDLPVEPGRFVAGLYVSTHLGADPMVHLPADEFRLVATAAVGREGDADSNGLFDAGVVSIQFPEPAVSTELDVLSVELQPGQNVLFQVRVWPVEHDSYASAFEDAEAVVGASPVIGPMRLGGGGWSIPSLADAPQFAEIVTGPWPIAPPPVTVPPPADPIDFPVLIPGDKIWTYPIEIEDPEWRTPIFTFYPSNELGTVFLLTNAAVIPFPYVTWVNDLTLVVPLGDITQVQPTGANVLTLNETLNGALDPLISVSPVIEGLGGMNDILVLAPDNDLAQVTLTGTLVARVGNDSLKSGWFEGGNLIPLALGDTVDLSLEPGPHSFTLVVEDGANLGLASVEVEVLRPGTAVEMLMDKMEASSVSLKTKESLRDTLQGAAAAFDRGQFKSGRNQLKTVLNKIRAQVSRKHPDVAAEWDRAVRDLLDKT